ncbi:MAG TPA: amino acid--tRNA ligase-related protein, partial [Vicinamibacteria bacterium]|nr:amino acid--tRNA ligase-related protein [Vicinamibacteria bacterium]
MTTDQATTSTRVVRISDFKNHVGNEIRLQGWLHNKRSSGKLQFLIVRDGSGFAQAVMAKAAVPEAAWAAAEAMGQESSLELTGRVKEDKRAPGGFEVDVTGLTAVQVAHDYPITPKEHGTAFLMENRHLWLRSPRQHAVIRVRHAVVKGVRDFLDDQGFTLVDTPIFTPAACEGTTTLFGVPYFDEGTAYLTQSGQLYNEATAAAHGKVYCFGPTFRAEKSKTRRHLTEFWMVEPEMAFAHLEDAVKLAEGLIVSVIERVLETRKE